MKACLLIIMGFSIACISTFGQDSGKENLFNLITVSNFNHGAISDDDILSTNAGERLLFVLPQEYFNTLGITNETDLEPLPLERIDEDQEAADKVYIVEKQESPAEDTVPAFSGSFGEGWYLIQSDEDQNLFLLIATGETPKEDNPLMVHIDVSRYSMKTRPMEPTATDWLKPGMILEKWRGYWVNDTGATPVVLVLLHF